MKFNSIRTATLLLAMGFILPAAANTGDSTTPVVQASATVPHMIGGVGLDERNQFESRARNFNFRLMFAESDGAFVVPDSVTVKRGASEVLTVSEGGPLIYMSVPAGVYSVQANYKGMTRLRNVQVTGHTPSVLMTWPTERRDPAAD